MHHTMYSGQYKLSAPTCDVQAYITHGADEPSAQENLLLRKVHMLIHHCIFLF